MKTCRRCGVELVPGENWYPSQEKHTNYICKTCVKERWRDRYASESEYREKVLKYGASWRERNPEKYKECYIRSAVCRILRDHSDELKDDPERLSTEFILSMVNDRGKDDRDV